MRMRWFGDKENTGPKKHQSVIDPLFTRAKMHWWLLGVIFVLAVVLIAFPMEDRRKLLNLDDFQLGEKSPRDVFAQVNVTYYDEAATEEKKQRDLTEVPPVFDLDFERLENAKEQFSIVRQVRMSLFSIDSKFQTDLGTQNVSGELRQEFGSKRISLSQDATVSIRTKHSEWLITDKGKRKFLVKKVEDKLEIHRTEDLKEVYVAYYTDTKPPHGDEWDPIGEELRREHGQYEGLRDRAMREWCRRF